MIPKPTVKDLARDAERDKSRADELNKDGYFSQYIAVIALAWIARAVAAERERDELRAEVERLKSALKSVATKRQFGLCWCKTADGSWCVGQPQCNASSEAINRYE